MTYAGPDPVPSAHPWRSNAELIAAAAHLGYIEDDVLDTTYGLGGFWKVYRPARLVAADIDPARSEVGIVDFTNLPWADGTFRTVVFDPPYKLRGTPALGDQDARYGTAKPAPLDQIIHLIDTGLFECARVTSKWLLVKVQDQVVSGRKFWLTHRVVSCMARDEFEWVDQLHLLRKPRPQPGGRTWRHSHSNYSTLLIFQKVRSLPRQGLYPAGVNIPATLTSIGASRA